MKRTILPICASLLLLSGCPSSSNGPESDNLGNPHTATWNEGHPAPRPPENPEEPEVVATVNGIAITRTQLQKPVIEAYGLNFLLHLIQLELVKERARKEGLTITPQDIADERMRRMDQMLNPYVTTDHIKGSDEDKLKYRLAEYERLFPQFQERMHISDKEFELAFETGAYLWKIADKEIAGQITDDAIHKAFDLQYGARIAVRDIKLNNQQELAQVQRLLQQGKKFEDVAKEKSRDPESAKKGGEIRPFSMAEPNWPEGFKQAAFALKEPGDISDAVNIGTSIHLIQLIRHIPQTVVKFEDHKEIVRKQLYNAMMSVQTENLRQFLQTEARDAIHINDPILRRQFVERVERAKGVNAGAAAGLRQAIADQRAAPQPTTQPTDQVPGRPEVARPPATRPGI